MPQFEALLGVIFEAEDYEAALKWYAGLGDVLRAHNNGNRAATSMAEMLLTEDVPLGTYPEGLAQGQVRPEDLRSGVWFEYIDNE